MDWFAFDIMLVKACVSPVLFSNDCMSELALSWPQRQEIGWPHNEVKPCIANRVAEVVNTFIFYVLHILNVPPQSGS